MSYSLAKTQRHGSVHSIEPAMKHKSFMAGTIDLNTVRTIVSPDQPWCQFGVRDPVILTCRAGFPVKFDGQYRLFFSGRDKDISVGGRTQVGWASSPDLVNWTVAPNPVFSDGNYATSGSVIEIEKGTYRIYYAFDTLKGYRYAETTDFQSWRINKSPILTPSQFNCHRLGLPHVFERDGIWYLLGEGLNKGFSIIGALSIDGKDWEPLAGGQGLYQPTAGRWDSASQANPSISHSPQYSELFLYNGNSSASDWDIGILKTDEPLRDVYRGAKRPLLTRDDLNADSGRLEGPRIVKTDDGHLLFYFLVPSANSFRGGRIFTVPLPEAILENVSDELDIEINESAQRILKQSPELREVEPNHVRLLSKVSNHQQNLVSEEAANDRLAEKYFEIWDTYPIQQYTNQQEGAWA